MSQRSLRYKAMPLAWAAALLILSACMSEHSSQIPVNAQMETSGNGHLSYNVPSDGTVWIYDVKHDRIVYSGAVVARDIVSVDPDANLISISGRSVAEKTLSPGEQHRVFFQANSASPVPLDRSNSGDRTGM